jgi:hypothetical protein
MTVTVYHRKSGAPESLAIWDFEAVVTFTFDKSTESPLDKAFLWTQNYGSSWFRKSRPEMKLLGDRSYRSTHLGDLMELDGQFYLVDGGAGEFRKVKVVQIQVQAGRSRG